MDTGIIGIRSLYPPNAPVTLGFFLSRLAICSLAWGSSFLLIKLMRGELSPLAIAACRGTIGGLTLAAFTLLRGQIPWPTREEWVPWLIIGAINGAIPNILVAIGLTRLDSGPAALIQSIGPLVTAIGAHLLFADERLNARSVLGILVGFCGVGLLIGPRLTEGAATLQGVLAMLGVAICYAIGNLFTRTVRHHDASRLALGQQMMSGIMATIAALAVTGPQAFARVPDHLWPVLALGIISTALPMLMFMHMITRVGPTRAALTGYTVPTVAIILGVLVLGERLTLWQILGGLIVFLGVWLVALSKRKPL